MKESNRFYSGSLFLGEVSQFSELSIELAAVSILQNQENSLVVVKPAVKPQHIGVAEAGLDVHFPPQLVLQPVLLDLLFEYHLQRHYILTLPENKKHRS